MGKYKTREDKERHGMRRTSITSKAELSIALP